MRTGMILLVVAACIVAAGCTKKNSLYLEPGRSADGPQPAHAPQKPAAPATLEKASDMEQAQR